MGMFDIDKNFDPGVTVTKIDVDLDPEDCKEVDVTEENRDNDNIYLTVHDLKEALKDLSDNMPVVLADPSTISPDQICGFYYLRTIGILENVGLPEGSKERTVACLNGADVCSNLSSQIANSQCVIGVMIKVKKVIC